MNNKKSFRSSIIITIGFLVFGLLLTIFPSQVMNVVAYTLAAITLLVGLHGLYKTFFSKEETITSKYGLVYGVVFIILSCLLFIKKGDIFKLLPYTLGVITIINSAIKLDYVVQLKRAKNENWKITLIISILCLAIGIVLLFNPLGSLKTMIQTVGIILIIYSILDFIETFVFKYNQSVEVTVQEATIISKEEPVVEKKQRKPRKKSTSTKTKKENKPKEEK